MTALLKRWSGGAIVVSHDRTLLRRDGCQIVELTTIGARTYGGNWASLPGAQGASNSPPPSKGWRTPRGRSTRLDRKTQLMRERKAKQNAAGARKAAQGRYPEASCWAA